MADKQAKQLIITYYKGHIHDQDDQFDLFCYLEGLEGFHGNDDIKKACNIKADNEH